MATTIIKSAVQQQLDSLASSQNAFDSVQTYIADVSPGGSGVATTVVSFFLAAFLNEMTTMFTEGTATYEDALADTDLWDDVTCAILAAIEADGAPNADNFAEIAGNISSIPYSPSSVPETIAQYVSDLGLQAILQTIQGSVFTDLDCSECDEGWTHTFDFLVDNGGWTPIYSGVSWNSSSGWTSVTDSGGTHLSIRRDFTATTINTVDATGNAGAAMGLGTRTLAAYNGGSTVANGAMGSGSGTVTGSITPAAMCDWIEIYIDTYPPSGTNHVVSVVVTGDGTDPF